MALMRGGGSAVDAVEMAVKVLEDREITNAGYGSNLAMDGVVECDAIVVDHFGRSGGAGAVAQIKNPVSLARLLLDHTTQTLSLRRVPPNLLVGQGATDFAYEHDMPVMPIDYLISPAARDRWRKWKNDLLKAEAQSRAEEGQWYGLSPPPSQNDLLAYAHNQDDQESMRTAHSRAMLASVWNEAQPISPPPSDVHLPLPISSSPPARSSSSLMMADAQDTTGASLYTPIEGSDPYGPPGMSDFDLPSAPHSTMRTVSNTAICGDNAYESLADGFWQHHRTSSSMDLSGGNYSHPLMHTQRIVQTSGRWQDGSSGGESSLSDASGERQPTEAPQQQGFGPFSGLQGSTRLYQTMPESQQTTMPLHDVSTGRPPPPRPIPLQDGAQMGEDLITDTVGAVAIDMYGNIACAASSGGIGMKHRGRIGPAALVGIGAAVIPYDAEDSGRECIATVTSGTGEHMGTTQAASKCSERLLRPPRKATNGGFQTVTDDEALKGFIEKDFMGHPSVKNSHSNGAIGILSAKMSQDGIWLYFGHNTDSFALASMHSDESRPVCTMSRNKGNGSIAQGGRAIRFRRRKT
ncbi:hypothetical protein LTR78_002077 [Recurvomyces mirabilis]|uniref:N-terminal nucleophile aminohydrolase n=1 Tax=Recurvomyces mirabilis TaxID=574656 RepID=A0AAE0WUC3_9PEZI|nr:hypothetical protein LTR78_002077 [Recurvomyces mirabilis]KAK5160535.1 hypothetical protein LTS14_001547 [Recurvomyces mirabilis]